VNKITNAAKSVLFDIRPKPLGILVTADLLSVNDSPLRTSSIRTIGSNGNISLLGGWSNAEAQVLANGYRQDRGTLLELADSFEDALGTFAHEHPAGRNCDFMCKCNNFRGLLKTYAADLTLPSGYSGWKQVRQTAVRVVLDRNMFAHGKVLFISLKPVTLAIQFREDNQEQVGIYRHASFDLFQARCRTLAELAADLAQVIEAQPTSEVLDNQ
jgi:hypothetical protein